MEGTANYVLLEKLKVLKGLLRTWNKEVFGNVAFHKAEALREISLWDSLVNNRFLSLEEVQGRQGAKENFEKWALMEEISWRQKSKELWLKEGDRNTGFFHQMANAHRIRNHMSKIKVDGSWVTQEEDIRRLLGTLLRICFQLKGVGDLLF